MSKRPPSKTLPSPEPRTDGIESPPPGWLPIAGLGGGPLPSLLPLPTEAPRPCAHRMITNMTREFPTKPTTNTNE